MDKQCNKDNQMTGKFGGSGEAPNGNNEASRYGQMEINFQGNASIQAFDGKTAWEINPWSGKKVADKMPAEGVKQMREMADFDGALVNYKQKGYTAELMGKEDMEGSEVYKIRLTDKDGDVTYYFLDTQTHHILKDSKKRKIKKRKLNRKLITATTRNSAE
jgi:hypothetical protein